MTITLDPTKPGYEYQSLLLSYVGKDDPAQVQAKTPRILRALVAEAGPNLRTRPAPSEWSVMELIGHIVDGELASSVRYRWIVAHDTPELPGYDQDLWVSRLRHEDADPDDLLTAFEGLRALNLALWGQLPVADRSRVGMHLERGPESYELTFALLAGHDRIHVDQARRTLEQVRAAR
jgi:DinB superfamily